MPVRLEVIGLILLDDKAVEHFERVSSVLYALQSVISSFSITLAGQAINLLPGNKDRVLECVIEGMSHAVITVIIYWLIKLEGIIKMARQNLSLILIGSIVQLIKGPSGRVVI